MVINERDNYFFIVVLQQGQLSRAEMSHLRLAAGVAMLKICEQKGVGDQFTAEQFYNLSQLMVVSIDMIVVRFVNVALYCNFVFCKNSG